MASIRPLALTALAVLALACPSAEAGSGRWSFGIQFGAPVYPRPWVGYDLYYYRPYPVYVRPVVPVVVEPAPVLRPVPAPPPAQPELAPPPNAVVPTTSRQPADVERHLMRLSDPDERVRAEAALQLGRLRAERAVDPLAASLAGDRSPQVREAAARGLGIIGSAKALPALRRAAQADPDRDVRHSAGFAVEVIQSR